MAEECCLYHGDSLAAYGFPGHPFGVDRHDVFMRAFEQAGLMAQVGHGQPVMATQKQIEYFHAHDYVEKVKMLSAAGQGLLDHGDTPAFKGVYQAAATVVGTGLQALEDIMFAKYQRAFIPIAGLHHARRDIASGFCVFNDCGVLIETLRRNYGINRVAYVDIDAHHGDGVFYAFEDDPDLIFVDLHEDGRFLYPGTGFAEETGKGQASGTKLNIPMRIRADDDDFLVAWEQVEAYLNKNQPEFILFQCGADSIKGDPITDMEYSEQSHAYAAERLRVIADQYSDGRLLVMGGGGYNHDNLARAWCAVMEKLV
ncbi:MAG: acetoin utilization protein AcuC [Gammaproteobacteria bacterium]|nr:acetoin utilization protein AcuC [Gammaproteobacteria bacterium]